jgi:ArsR family transcriptional regulator
MSEYLRRMTEVFKALGDQNRLKIIRYVATRNQRLGVAEIADRIGISISAVSQHMKVLRQARIVDYEKVGNHVYYFVNEEALMGFRGDIDTLMDMVFTPCEGIENCADCPRREECQS